MNNAVLKMSAAHSKPKQEAQMFKLQYIFIFQGFK